MARRTRWLLAGLVAVALGLMAYDASRPWRLGAPVTPAVTPSVESPRSEVQRGLDKTPLIYPAQFVDTLVERLRGGMVMATAVPDGQQLSGLVVPPGDIVVAGAGEAETWRVVTATGRIVTATRVATDSVRGIMLLRPDTLDGPVLPAIPFGPPALALGSPVVALHATPTALVTQLLPAPGTEASLIARLQLERLSPGTAVVDLDGRLVAMLGAGVHGGVPFTSEDVQNQMLPALRDGTSVGVPWLGLDLQDLTPALASRFPAGRMVVVYVEPGSPAELAGVRADDVVQSARVGDTEVATVGALEQRLEEGAVVTLGIARPGRVLVTQRIAVEIGRRLHPRGVDGLSGVSVSGVGVAVDVAPASAAARAGLRTGDRIEEIDGRTATVAAVRGALRGDRQVLLTVQRAGRRFFVVHPPGDPAS
jgi:S1-C subfamily serine protease